jgi:hypothetical protein
LPYLQGLTCSLERSWQLENRVSRSCYGFVKTDGKEPQMDRDVGFWKMWLLERFLSMSQGCAFLSRFFTFLSGNSSKNANDATEREGDGGTFTGGGRCKGSLSVVGRRRHRPGESRENGGRGIRREPPAAAIEKVWEGAWKEPRSANMGICRSEVVKNRDAPRPLGNYEVHTQYGGPYQKFGLTALGTLVLIRLCK